MPHVKPLPARAGPDVPLPADISSLSPQIDARTQMDYTELTQHCSTAVNSSQVWELTQQLTWGTSWSMCHTHFRPFIWYMGEVGWTDSRIKGPISILPAEGKAPPLLYLGCSILKFPGRTDAPVKIFPLHSLRKTNSQPEPLNL